MAKSNLLNTHDVNLKGILANGLRYQVPKYQRDYSWKEDHWEDLWMDIEEMSGNSDGRHYMGTIVVQKRGLEDYTVIDGQQRLATLSILVLAAIRILNELAENGVEAADNRQRMEILRSSFVGTTDPASLKHSSKINLNANNDPFYQSNVVQLRAPVALNREKETNQLLWKALGFFTDKLRAKFEGNKAGERLALFINETVAIRLLFIRVTVEDEVSAYMVFETLNARGLELTPSDLLKNYLMSKVTQRSQTEIDHVLELWRRIGDAVGLRYITEFLRHYLNSIRRPYVRHERLYKTIRASITDSKAVFDLLHDLEPAAVWYQALDDHTDLLWEPIPNAKEQVRILNLFGVKQYKPVILAASRRMQENIVEVLRFCVVVSLRYNIISDRNTNELEKIYNEVAVDIHDGRIQSAAQLRQALQPIYVPDEEFRDAFARKSIPASGRQSKIARFLLCAIERQLGNAQAGDESPSASVEHVLPEVYSDGWADTFNVEQHSRYHARIGNYLILEPALNRESAQKPFADKKSIFKRSSYKMAESIAEHPEWNPSSIEKRQAELARIATGIWRL